MTAAYGFEHPTSAVIAVVDGDPASRTALCDLVRSDNYQTRAVDDGVQLLELIHRERIDVVVLGVNMPGLHGLEVCRRLRSELSYDVGIIFLSGSRAEPFDRVAGLEAGADDYVIRPFDPGELLARIAAVLRRLRSIDLDDFEPGAALTPRQREVVSMLAHGLALEDIALRLVVTRSTVRKHVERIYRKLGVRSRGEAVAWAFNEGLVSPPTHTHSREHGARTKPTLVVGPGNAQRAERQS